MNAFIASMCKLDNRLKRRGPFLLLAVLVLLAGLATQTFAAGGTPDWVYNPTMVGKQETRATAIDSTGHMILAGYVVNASYDYYLIKVLPGGSGLAWPAKTVDFNGAEDQAAAVAVDGNDDIIVTGYVHNGINFDIHTVKYRGSDGAKLWQHTFNGTGSGDDFAKAITVDAYNNIYVGGTMRGPAAKDDIVIIKYVPGGPNPDGTPTWVTSYNGPDDGHDRLSAIAVGLDGIAVTGESQNAALNFDFVVVKFALDKQKAWEKRYSDAGNGKGLDVALDGSGNVIATGYIDTGAGRDRYTVKYPSAEGPFVWEKIRDLGSEDEGRALWLDSSGNVYVTGSSFSLTTQQDLSVTRHAAADGAFTAPGGWYVDYNTANGNDDVGIDIVGDDSGDIFVTTTTNYYVGGYDDIITYKFSKDHGTLLWSAVHGLAAKHDRPLGLGLAPDGHPVMAGWSDSDAGGYDFIAVKYDAGALDPPTALTASTVSISEVALSWADNSNNEDNFVLERRNGEGEWALVSASLPANTVSYNDTGLTPDHRYYYRVKAINTTDGSSAWSNEADARTTIIGYAPPVWQHIYAGAAGGDDQPAAVAVGPDNHPVITGFTFDAEGEYDYYTLKLDRADAATVQWAARYNDGDNESDYATAVAVDSQNRAVVSGFASLYYPGGSGNTNDIYTLGYPAGGGAPTWNHQYNGPNGNDDRSTAVATAVDGSDNVVVVGYGKNASLNNDIYVIKYSADGTPSVPLWAATPYNGGGDDQPANVAYDPFGDIFVVGKTWNGSNYDYFVAKYHGGNGSLAWGGAPKLYDGAGHSTDYATALAVDAAGNLYVTGYSVGSGGSGDIVTLKYDGATGDIVPGWPRIHDGGGYDAGVAIGIDVNNGDIVVAGTTFVAPGNHDVVVVRYTPAGAVVWTRFLDFTGSDEAAAALSIDRSGVACVAAATDSGSGDDIVTVMFDHNGLTVGANIVAGTAGGVDYPVDVAFNAYGEAFVAGVTTNAANNTDFLVFKATSTVMQAPTPLTATQLYTEANLSWSDNSLDESGFRIEVNTGACNPEDWSYVGSTGANATGFLASGLNPNSSYCFRVQSYNALGEASRWTEVEVVTAPADAPGTFVATVQNTTDVLLEWEDRTTGENKFNLQWCEGAGCTFPTDPQVNVVAIAADTERYVFATACEGGTYRFRINAEKNDRWVSGYAVSSEVTMAARQAPAGLSSDWVSEAWVDLKWTDTTRDETGFIIERCQGSGCSDFSAVETVNSPAGNLLHLRMDEAPWAGTPGEVIDLSLAGNHGRAYGAATTTSGGKHARAGLYNGTTAYVATPLLLDQSAATTPGATFAAWVYPASTSANNHYVIGTDNGGNDWSLVRNGGTWYVANGSDAALVNTGVAVTPNVWQHLAVVFNPASGVTLYKNNANAWSNAAIAFDGSSAPVLIGRHGSLNQEFFDGRLDEVAVFNRPLSAAEVGVLFNHGLRRYIDRTIVLNTFYNYQVKATKAAPCPWTSNSSNSHQVTTDPPAPSGLLASASHTNRVNLFWVDNTTTETKFVVERCTSAGCVDFSALPVTISADAISFNDDTVCSNTSYRYRVKAVRDGVWDSAYSSEATVSTPSLVAPVVTLGTVSEEQISMQWPLSSADLTGYTVSRCQGDATFCASDLNYSLQTTKPVLPTGAVMMLPMDEPQWRGTSDEVSDISGSGNHGTAYGGVNTVASGKTQFGGSFDGIDDYVTTKLNINQGTGATGVTFEAWVYPTVTSGSRFIISTDDGGYDWGVGIFADRFGVYTGSTLSYLNTVIWASPNAWQHVVATFHPSSGITVYKNGSESSISPGVSTDNADASVTIGRQGTSNANYFAGRIDNVVVYNRVLTAAEVLARYQSYNANSHSESTLPSTTEYHYRVAPYKTDDCGISVPYASVEATTLTPPAPINLTLTAASTTQVNLGWTDLATSETGYRIQWCEGAGCTFPVDPTVNSATLGVNAQSYIDTNVCEGQSYRYQVRAEKNWVSESDYTWVSAWTAGSVTTAAKAEPATDNFTATTVSESQISLSWSDGNADEDAYLLQRCYNNDAASCQVTDDAAFAAMPSSLRPTLWFKMDEATWGTVFNSAIGGSNATKYGDAVPINDAQRGQVGKFDGSGDYLRVAHYAGINPTKAITVSTWAKSTGATWNSDYSMMSKRDAYILGPVSGSGSVRFNIFRSGDTWRDVTVNPGVDITQWHQYTGVYDGTDLVLYVDGVERGRANWPGAINADTGVLEIGRDDGQTANNRNLAGNLDNALIFDQALTPSMVLALYNNQLNLSVNTLDSGLTPGVEYFYRLRADKSSATCDWPIEWTLKSATTIAPPAPTNLKLTTINTTQIDLVWTDTSGSETGYRVQRCEGTGCSFPAEPTASDSVLLVANTQAYSDTTVKEGTSYSYRVRAEKADAGGWSTAWLGPLSATTVAKLDPGNLTANRQSEAGIGLSWDDSNGDETGFKIERCAGVGCSDFAEIGSVAGNGVESANLVASGTLATGNFSQYVTNVTHPTTGVTVRVLAIPNTGTAVASNSGALALKTNTDYIVTFEAWCSAGVDINLQNDLIPDTLPEFQRMVSTVPKTFRVVFNSNHVDMLGTTYLRFFHYNVGRTIYVTNIRMAPPTRATYTDTDSGLLPDTSYSYRVKTYKTANGLNDWAATSNSASATTSVVAPSGLVAAATDTTTVKLTWTDNASSETGTEIWRCQGAGCGGFAKIGEVGPNATAYIDDKVADDTDYRYQVAAKNDGLSASGGGTWSHYKTVVISPFAAYAYYQVTVPYDSKMRSDYGDLRFYDETANRQLAYWVKSSDAGSATVWILAGKYNTINMYYGNPAATDAGNKSDFIDEYTFPGTVIDAGKWVETDTVNAIRQNNGLILSTTNDYSYAKALISQKTYNRANGWELYADLTTNDDTNGAASDIFILGWWLNQTATVNYNQFVHGFTWYNYQLRSYEKASLGYHGTYAANTHYEIKVVLTAAGAQYHVRGGTFPNWTLLATRNTYTDQIMRIAVNQYSHNATIHSLAVTPTLSAATIGSENPNARGSYGYPWPGTSSNIADVKTEGFEVPRNLHSTADSDTQITLTWIDDNNDETGFDVERCVGGTCTVIKRPGSGTSFVDSGLEPSKSYTYRVRAYKEAFYPWTSEFSAPLSVAPAPQSATGLTATPLTKRMIELNWTDTASDEEGYEIEVMVWNGRFIKTGEVGANTTTYIDKVGIEPGQLYTYRVRPFRGVAKSPYSNEASTQTTNDLEDGTCVPAAPSGF